MFACVCVCSKWMEIDSLFESRLKGYMRKKTDASKGLNLFIYLTDKCDASLKTARFETTKPLAVYGRQTILK